MMGNGKLLYRAHSICGEKKKKKIFFWGSFFGHSGWIGCCSIYIYIHVIGAGNDLA